MIRRILAASLLVLGGSAVAAAQTPVVMMPMALPGATGELAQRLLAAQNRERIAVGHAPLQWDPALAASAATYGPTLASLRRLVHSPRETRPGQRENLAMAFHGTLSPEQMVDMWSREKKLLQPGLFPTVSRTGNWADVAHYTQMVWPTTTHVGCALYSADWDYLICRYSPPGNIDGKPVFTTAALARP
ncbi:CAP domain-containing protein [Sphingomonas hankyongi]|uniref:CAP domain-containing protein n=1 Tax=Sphingomonas hankyongi TaxID=2908209 RepID=A0ABT0S2U2_9SPHN|nr:CAP domain-containing protein [Sphingomonas hankyongi]MCL6729949.1 CAP domain-containing protein [Sphingomonas hankyongi]